MTDSQRRRILVMRHAHAEPFAREDSQRSLTSRGTTAAAAAGEWVAQAGLAIDVALVSSATRTRQTWELFASAAGCADVEVAFEDALYSAGTDTVLECLRNVPDDAHTAVFLGHNPTAGMLIQVLGDGMASSDLQSRLASGFPPASIAVLELTGSWTDVDFASARLVDVRVVHG